MKACFLCPRRCGAARPASGKENASGEIRLPGFCRSPRNPVVAKAMVHFWEEPVISGEKGSGAVFFSGCNLQCVFCQNYEISSLGQGREITAGRLREIYFELVAQGVHNIDLVTPAHFSEAVLESLREPLPVPVIYNGNGYDAVETLRSFEGKIQIYLPDFKYGDDRLARKYSGVSDYVETAKAAIREMYRQTGPFRIGEDGLLKSGTVIRHLILPGQLDNSFRVIDFVAETFAPGEALFSLMNQYLPRGRVLRGEFPELDRKVTPEEYEKVANYLVDSGVVDGFMQESSSADAGFIPDFDGSGV